MDANISTASGGLGVELPVPHARVLRADRQRPGLLPGRDRRRSGRDRQRRPAAAAAALVTGKPQFSDADYFGEPVRVGSYARLLDRPLAGQAERAAGGHPGRRDAGVAPGLHARAAAGSRSRATCCWSWRPPGCWRWRSAGRCGRWRGCAARSRRVRPHDLTPISAQRHPGRRAPAGRGDQPSCRTQPPADRSAAAFRRRRLAPAAHAADDAGDAGRLRAARDRPGRQRKALVAIKSQLDETVRQTNQMLALARTDSAEIEPEPVDLDALAERADAPLVDRQRASAGIDLGLRTRPRAG